MFVSHKALNGRHLIAEFFRRGEERKRHRLAEEEAREWSETVITTYGIYLTPVYSFKYLVRALYALDEDWVAVVNNL